MKRISQKLIGRIKFLRKSGFSIPEISQTVAVAKSTVFRYAKDVEILPSFYQVLRSKRGGSRKRKQVKELRALEEAREFTGLTDREKTLFLSALYWGEGSKKDFGLSNTDPNMVRVFVTILRQTLGVADDRLRVSVRIFEDLDKDECLSFWSEVVGIPKEQFVSVNVLSGKKKGKLVYGMCRIRVKKGGDLLKKVVGINKIIGETLPL